jgi:hypothetical protein
MEIIMLTVTHVEDNGSESTYSAPHGVRIMRGVQGCAKHQPEWRDVLLILGEPHHEAGSVQSLYGLEGGRVFVMNAAGKTVAHHRLRSSDREELCRTETLPA